MSFIVYAIHNQVYDKIYIGYTSDLKKRLARHNGILSNKRSSFTKKNQDIWRLIYSENYNTRKEATRREKELKSYQGRKFVRSLIKNDKGVIQLVDPPTGGSAGWRTDGHPPEADTAHFLFAKKSSLL